jgi:hypothetical protein
MAGFGINCVEPSGYVTSALVITVGSQLGSSGYLGVLSSGGKGRPGRDADHSPPSSAEDVNE